MPLKTTEFVTNNNMVIVPHPPYTPDLAPCDFALFPKLKMKLKGRHFETVSDIQRESQAVLDSIKENESLFGISVLIEVEPSHTSDWEHGSKGLCISYESFRDTVLCSAV
jgi:hypothetical protein